MVRGEYSQYNLVDEQLVSILQEIGMKKNDARVLGLMFQGYERTPHQIERETDLRQPEVSLALSYLTKQHWVQVVRHLTENKGRPVKVFQLAESVDEILDRMKDEFFSDYSKKIDSIERIRELVFEARVLVRE